jgi:hypothetical protein
MAGVVYVSQAGEKVILTRGAAQPVPLEQSSVQPGHRFTFYDQNHTTGVDIAQAPTACAVVTVGKDTVLRDYAQGAWRMRRLGQGQTLRVWLIPEVARLVASTARLCRRPVSQLNLATDTMAWLVVNSLRAEKLQAAKLRDLRRATEVRAPAVQRLRAIVPALVRSVRADATWDAETDRCIARLTESHLEDVRLLIRESKAERDAELGKHRAAKYRNKPVQKVGQEAIDGWMKELEAESGQIAEAIEMRENARCEVLTETFEARKAAVRSDRAADKPPLAPEEMRWLHRCMVVLVEPMEFGVASTVGGGLSARCRPAAFQEACDSLLAAAAAREGGPAEPESPAGGESMAGTMRRQEPEPEPASDELVAAATAATSSAALVSDAASVFYDNEVQNEKEQEQQVEIQDEDEPPPSVYPGQPDPEQRFQTSMLQPGGATPSALKSAAAAHREASGGSDGLIQRTGGDGRQQLRSLVQGVELVVRPPGELPWYPLPVFDMKSLPCAITPTVPIELRFSTNHTAKKQRVSRDGEPLARRLRNIITVLHHLPDHDGGGGREDEQEWMMAVSLAEGQSLVLLLREGEAGVLGGAALGLVGAERGELLASTALYRERLAKQGGRNLGRGWQLMRFLNNAKSFSLVEVRLTTCCCIDVLSSFVSPFHSPLCHLSLSLSLSLSLFLCLSPSASNPTAPTR